jgi:hypothetical protein
MNLQSESWFPDVNVWATLKEGLRPDEGQRSLLFRGVEVHVREPA